MLATMLRDQGRRLVYRTRRWTRPGVQTPTGADATDRARRIRAIVPPGLAWLAEEWIALGYEPEEARHGILRAMEVQRQLIDAAVLDSWTETIRAAAFLLAPTPPEPKPKVRPVDRSPLWEAT